MKIEEEKQKHLWEKELIELKHKYRLEEIAVELKAKIEAENFKHNHDLVLQRIRSAEIRRSIEQKRTRY